MTTDSAAERGSVQRSLPHNATLAAAGNTCGEVYDYALGDLVAICQEAEGHEGAHCWTGNDNMPNRVVLLWKAVQ